MEENVIQNRFGMRCQHSKYLVDDSLNTIECGICHKELNPIWVLKQLCNEENRARMNVREMEKIAAKADKKNRCKCENCGKMTKIQRH